MTDIETKNSDKILAENFNLDQHLVSLLMNNSFFGEISRRIHKIRTDRIPTAGVTWNRELDSICLYYNPQFFIKLTNKQIKNVLIHEFYHLIFGHLTNRRKKPHKVWNWGTDAAINSIIFNSDKCDVNEQDNEKLSLPSYCIIPGRKYPKNLKESDKKEHKDVKTLGDVLEKFPQMLASEDYFMRLMQEGQDQSGNGKCKSCGGTGKKCNGNSSSDHDENNDHDDNDSQNNGNSSDGDEPCPDCQGTGFDDEPGELDDHESWDDLTEEEREYVQNRVRNIVTKAVHKADSSNGWGNVPTEMQGEIRRSISNIIPWRAVLKHFLGTLLPGHRTTTMKKINKKYPYIHAGVKKGRLPLLLIAIDQSGSVSDEVLTTFFGELSSLTKNVSIDILPFDCSADMKDIYRWRKGTHHPTKRTKCGGTNFDAPTDVLNSPQLRGKYDGMLIMTDGEAFQPKPSRVKRGWVLGEGQKLNFNSNELQIFVDKAKPIQGAWR